MYLDISYFDLKYNILKVHQNRRKKRVIPRFPGGFCEGNAEGKTSFFYTHRNNIPNNKTTKTECPHRGGLSISQGSSDELDRC